ncbi:MAG TPA: phospholipid carrier-dependent glycosyltransferase [Gammaproteobacteria bacterium]|jgi:4-amino-4-deoxy-L-arabinose transferase-like glycosyltransferase|nr:phospholipid carrier-dependent glycosyltransferase [Gammaproteobacteria bacterium]
MNKQHTTTRIADIALLGILFCVLFLTYLGVRPLFTPDEGRYAEIAREMVASGDYITPHLNHIKYFEKPVLFYWLEAAAIHLNGLSMTSLRAVNGLLALLGCLLTYFTASKLYNRTTGLYAAIILGTSLLYFVMAHMVSLDLPVTVFIMACLYTLLLATQTTSDQQRRYYCLSAAIAAALAVLTKGLIGIVFPLLIFGAWLTLLGQWRMIRHFSLLPAACLFFIIATPWHLLAQAHNPEFFYFYFIEQQFLRYTTAGIGHYQPNWFFIPYLILGFFPWIAFLAQAILDATPRWKNRHTHQVELFFLLWAGIVFAFFSFSSSKLIPYILPLFPPLAILTARYLASPNYHGFMRDRIFVITCVFTSTLLMGLLIAAPSLDTRTIRPLAMTLKPLLQPEDDVITYHQYYQDLPFYLERRVSILDWQNELRFGMAHQDTEDWMIDDATFWNRWHSQKHVFMVISLSEYRVFLINHPQEKVFVLNKTKENALVSNFQPLF